MQMNLIKKMEHMERIKQIWTQLEVNSTAAAGLFRIRYSESSKCDVSLGVKFPEKHRMIIIRTPFVAGKGFLFKYEVKGLKFDKIYDQDDNKFVLLNLVLIDKQFSDVFDVLVADILKAIIDESEISVILKKFTERLIKWQSLFEKFSQQGLTPEEQRGLFGELYFLKKYLQLYTNYSEVINTWGGPEKQVRDFQSGDWAVEVKTTHGNNHQKVHISSERQLDTTNIGDLFLYHISLDQMQNSGETLNNLVDSVVDILQSDTLALNRFKSKIYEAGYFELQRDLYDSVGYFVRQDVFYKVENDFPRIQEHEIRSGVGDVKYSIILSQCLSYIQEESTVFNTIKTT